MEEQKDERQVKKEAYKEAMREFLEEQKSKAFEGIGRWTAMILATALAGALLWVILKANGWNHTVGVIHEMDSH